MSHYYLTVDIGNTQSVVGVFHSDSASLSPLPCFKWRFNTNKFSTTDEIIMMLDNIFQRENILKSDIQKAAFASVVPSLNMKWKDALGVYTKDVRMLAGADNSYIKVTPLYVRPEEIGADRIANAVAAVFLYGTPAIVVDMGTATNIEVIDCDGVFIGGIIAPGIEISTDALFGSTSKISPITFETSESLTRPITIGKNTQEALLAGILLGEVAKIDGLIQMIFEELGYECQVLVTGGLCHQIASFSTRVTQIDEDLTLKGLFLTLNS